MQRDTKIPTLLRLPEQMRAWLKAEASQNGRTLNGEVTYRLRKQMELEKQGNAR